MKTILILKEHNKAWGTIPPGTALRVRDEDAERLVKEGSAKYCPKSVFKEQQKELETNNNKENNNA